MAKSLFEMSNLEKMGAYECTDFFYKSWKDYLLDIVENLWNDMKS